MSWTKQQTEDVARRRLRHVARREMLIKARRQEAREYAGLLATQIADADPTVRRIWGFGSAFEPRQPFREDSDIDLAVEGGSLVAWRLSQASSWKIDWLELDQQDEAFAEAVKKRGVIIFERR